MHACLQKGRGEILINADYVLRHLCTAIDFSINVNINIQGLWCGN